MVKYKMESKLFLLESLSPSLTSIKLRHETYSILNNSAKGQNNFPNFVKAGTIDTCLGKLSIHAMSIVLNIKFRDQEKQTCI